ncbi:MAG: hypothetical protein KDD44_12210, partial [Bdellovibrionales bacterium]|nr:hypothetical protein [Bdellovibrionales bacterium]
PLSSMPAFEKVPRIKSARRKNKVSYELSPYGICLPCGMNLTRSDVKYVCRSLRNVLGEG